MEMSVSLSTNQLILTEPLISPVNYGKALSLYTELALDSSYYNDTWWML